MYEIVRYKVYTCLIMKYLFVLLLLWPIAGKAQSIALLDQQWKATATYTDSLTLETVLTGVFPIYLKDIEPVAQAVEQLQKKINLSHMAGTDKTHIGHTVLVLQTKMIGHKRQYHISLNTECNGFKTYLPLVQGAFDRVAQQRLIAFADYLKNSIP